ncbi:MAG: hypothetical protein ABMA13_21320 [Chthoniobacteraceae bacterium]
MPFDPSLPAPNSPLESAVVRDQFQALFNLINAIVTVVAAQIDGVTTGAPGTQAGVTASVSGGTLHFSFTLPRGAAGTPGQPFASAVIDGVQTLNPGESAFVNVSFDGTNVHFDFGIPRGADGANGTNGEVSAADLANAIAGTSANTNGVSVLGQSAATDYDQGQMQTLLNKVDELILAQRR